MRRSKEEGIALFTTIILALLSFIVIITVMYITTTGIKISGAVTRYTTALEAAKGGTEDVLHDIKAVLVGSTLIGAWRNNTSVNKLEQEYSTTPPTTPQSVITNYDWKKEYGDYEVYGLIVSTHIVNLGVGKLRYYYNFEIVAINKNNPTAEKAWLSVFYQLDKS